MGYSKTPKGYGLEQNEISIAKVVTYLEYVIKTLGNGRVNLIPIVNTRDKHKRYQVLERKRLTDRYKFLPSSGVFKINTISDPNYKAILEHAAKLMLSGDIGFVMKEYDENIGDLESYLGANTEMIIAFTRERVLAPDDIYSKKVDGEFNTYKAHQIVITGYSTYFILTQRRWKGFWVSSHIWTSGRANTDFVNYFATIENDVYWRQLLGANLWGA